MQNQPPNDPSGNLSMLRYAAVRAALAEGFPLSEVLEVEGVLPSIYEQSDAHWQRRLERAKEACSPLYDQYEAAVAAAEDALARRVDPLDADVAAWAAFQSALAAAAEESDAFLAGLKLGRSDLSRLTRLWVRRLEQDATLRQQMEYSQSQASKLPALTVAPRVLRRSAAADAAGAPRKAEPGPAREPAESPGPLPLFMQQQQQQAPLMQALELAPPVTAPPFNAPAVAAAPAGPVPPPPAPLPQPALPHAPGAGGTQDVSAFLAGGPATPFKSGPAAPIQAPAPRDAHRPSSAGGTQDVSAFLAGGPAVPFHGAPPPPGQPVVALPPRVADRAPPAAQNAAGTQDVSAFLGEALPFAHDHERGSHPPAGPDNRPSFPMPFAPRPSGPPAPASPAAAPAPPYHGGLLDRSSSAPNPPPALTIEQYASLCVELQMRPDPAGRAATFQRYRLTEAQIGALSARYNDWIAKDPGARAAYERAAAGYRAWLASQRR